VATSLQRKCLPSMGASPLARGGCTDARGVASRFGEATLPALVATGPSAPTACAKSTQKVALNVTAVDGVANGAVPCTETKHLKTGLDQPRRADAYADRLLTAVELLSYLKIASRSRSSSMKSIRRYTQPARHLRQLQRLSKSQLLMAMSVESKIPYLLQAL
jgi:hypothetical protein